MTNEKQAIAELKAMPQAELDLVPYDTHFWICAGKNCSRKTKIRDYGLAPEYFHKSKNIRWFNLYETFFMCAKHYKMYKRLMKNFEPEHVHRRLFNFKKNLLG